MDIKEIVEKILLIPEDAPLRSAAERRDAEDFTMRIVKVAASHMREHTPEGGATKERARSIVDMADQFARRLVVLRRTSPISSGDADRALWEFGFVLGGETEEQRDQRWADEDSANEKRREEAALMEQKRQHEIQVAKEWAERREAEEAEKKSRMSVWMWEMFEKIRRYHLVPKTPEEQTACDALAAEVRASMDVALQHYPPVARDARDLLDYAIQEAGRFAIIPELSEASRVEYRMESGVDYDPEESRATWRELAVSLGPLLVQSVLGQAPDGTDFWREADEIAERTEASAP